MINLREHVYRFIVWRGMKVLGTLFPDVHMSTPAKPTDRFLEYPFVMKHLPADKAANILDIGCSGSFFPLMVSALGYKITGCDIRPYEILNNITFKNFTFLRQDIIKNPLPAGHYDLVTCISVLEHIGLKGRYGSPDDATGDIAMVQDIKRLLKPGGRALLTVPYGKAEVLAPYERIYDLAGVRKLIGDMKVVEEKYYSFDRNDDWKECTPEEGQLMKCTPSRYGLALLYLQK